jgi:hypothetical protein
MYLNDKRLKEANAIGQDRKERQKWRQNQKRMYDTAGNYMYWRRKLH